MKTNACSVCGKEIGSYKRIKGMCENCYGKKWRKEHSEHCKEYMKKWLKEHSEYHKEHNKKNYYRIRKEVLTHYGNKCVDCDETRIKYLQLDHKKNDGKAHRKEIHNASIYRWAIKNNYPDRLQILCHLCNLVKLIYGERYKSERKKWIIRIVEKEKQKGYSIRRLGLTEK